VRARLPWLLALGYALLFTALGALKYAVHRNFVDFGIFAQTAASAFGCFCNPIEGSHWAFHFSPVLYIAGAALLLWRSPLTLIALQSIACALVIPPVYGLVLRRAEPAIASMSAIVVALYPPLAGLAFVDFHENAFAPAAVAWGAWAFDGGYAFATVLCALAAICVKEDQAIFVGFAGLAGAWRLRGEPRARTALFCGVLGVLAAALFFAIIQPHHVAAPRWSPERFYAWTRADVNALFPGGVLQRLGFLALILVPLALLPFRTKTAWFALPALAEVLLSRMSTTFTLGTHYTGAWLGYLIVAFAFAVRRLPQPRVRATVWACIGLCVLEFALADPLHPGMNLRAVQTRDRTLDRMLSGLPRDVSIATQEEAYTHLALRDPHARLLPESASAPIDACFVLIDRDFPASPRLQEYGHAFMRLVKAHQYVLVRAEGGAQLYRRNGSCR
jgi:uncharacterized membrane protein